MKKLKHFMHIRLTAMLFVLVCVLGLLPASAFAAGTDTIKLEKFGMSGVSYTSASLGTCTLHQMYYDYGGTTTVGFCGTKGGGMGSSLIGQTWGNPTEITNSTVKTMMAYYYAHSTGVFTDEARALGVDTIWDAGYTWYMNAWVQAVLWRYKAGTISDPTVACAEELMAVYNSLEKTNYTSIDQGKDGSSFRSRAQYILDLGAQGVWGDCTVREYTFTGAGSTYHPASSVQAVVIGDLSVDVTEETYILTVKKVDATNPTKGLPGAGFHIESVNGSYSKDIVTGSDGTYTLRGLTANTYAVTESSSPDGYEIDNAGPVYAVLPSNGSNTVTVTFTDTPIITGSGSIRKVDADNPSKGLAGAVIKIEGIDNNFTGTYTTVEGGALADVPWDTMPIGSFIATEVTPPAGYTINSDPDKVRQEFYWDGQTDVSLVFEDDAKVKIQLLKQDDSGNPLPDAVFNILKDGQIIGSEATTAAGTITVTNVTEGLYAFLEVSSPSPFAKLSEPVLVYVDQATVDGGGTVTVTATDQKLPNLTIQKLDKQSKTPIPDTVFSIDGIHYGYHTEVTTNAAGIAVLEAIPVDCYEVSELSVKEPYVVSDEPTQTIWLGPGDDQQLIFENLKKPLLTISKTEAGTEDNTPIPGTVFLVEGIDSDYRDEWTTGADGTVSKYVAPGSFQISEKSVPAPYYISETESERVQTISLNAGDEKTVSFQNYKRPYIEILKENSITHDPIENVKMQVWYASNNTSTGEYNDLGVYYTDADGRILLSEPDISLRDGWYRVRELEAAPGFSLPDEDTQEVFIPAGGSYTFRFQDRPLSAICVWKYDSKTGAALSDCWFQVRYLSGNTSGTGGTVIGTYRTSENGSFTVTGCKSGTYIIEELSSDGSHVIDTPPQTVYLSGEEQEVIQVYVGNSAKGSLLVTKVDDEGQPLSGVEFLVTKSDGTLVGDANGKFTTALDGTFLVENVDPNTTLVVKETRQKAGYILDEVAQTAVVKAGQCVQLQFVNHKAGNLVIHKLSSADKTPLEGVQFKLTYADGKVVDTADGKLSSNGLYFSNAEGQVIIPNVTGTIIATEVASIDGFAIDPNTRSQTVVINPGDDTQHLYFYNDPLCSLTLSKVDSVTSKPIPNTTFSVKDGNGNLIGRYTTGQDGTVTVTGLLPGATVVVSEYKVPDAYVLNPMPQTITLKSGKNTVTSGAVSGSDSSTGSSGDNSLVFENDPKMTLTVKKYIKGTNYEPLAGVCFKIVDGSGKPVGSGDGTFYTNSAGEIVVEGLEPGTTVTAREISTVEGFVLDGEPKSVEIKASDKAPELIFWNERAGSLVIQKKSSLDGSPLAGVQFLLTYADGSYVDTDNGHMSSKGLYETDAAGEIRITGITGTVIAKEIKSLPNFTIDQTAQTVTIRPDDCQTLVFYNTPVGGIEIIKVDEDDHSQRIPNATFEIRRMDGALVDTVITGADGRVFVTLEAGSFYAVETACPKEYTLDSTPHYFEVVSGKTTPPLTVTNRKGGSALIHKVDSLTGEGIYGVTFLISDAKGNPIGTYQSDNEGYVYIDKQLADGKYTARELECADGYILDTQPKTFYVEYGGCTTITWPNTAVRGQIQIIKKSADYNSTNGLPAGTPLAGATFEIYNERTGNKVDTIVTGANGLASSKPLPLSRYIIRETKAPANYGASTETYTAVLEYSGQIVKLEITNKSLSTGVSIEKTGPKEVVSGQPVRYVFSKIGNTSNVSLQSFYWRDTLPAAVRLDKVVTGTYNFPGTYKIVYKVNNTGDYRTLADSLSTSQNYTLAASPAALGLASNERVTEIMFVFGQVPGGFSQVEAPMLYCTALSGLASGSSFVNVADVGGTYNGVWVQAVSRWVTTVYGKPTPLPKTGY